MKTNNKFWVTASLVFVLLFLVSACSGNKNIEETEPLTDGTEKNVQNENGESVNRGEEKKKEIVLDETPVTVTVGMNATGYLTEEEFDRFITQPVKKLYPWIDVEVIHHTKGRSLPELVVANEVLDITINNNITRKIDELTDLGLAQPITDLIGKFNVDLNKFEPETLNAIKAAMHMDELTGLPYTRHFDALYYNQDIFDMFGVSYPKDGLTWDEAYELARNLTREQDGVQYQGFKPNVIERPASQLTIAYVDPKTNKSLLESDPFKRVLETMVKIHQIPGNEQIAFHSAANNLFSRDRTLAMLAGANILYDAGLNEAEGLNWDIAQLPTWPGLPNVGYRIDEHLMSITSTSKNREAAFLVMMTVTSDEVQLDMSKNGRFTVLNNKKIKEAFGSEMKFMEGKNVEAIFKNTPAETFKTTRYDGISINAFNGALRAVIEQGTDLNTALKNAAELVNQQILEAEAFRN